MSFTIPDNDEAFHNNQSIWMQTDINALVAGFAGDGVLSGCAVSEDGGGASMDLDITSGTIQINDTAYSITGSAAAVTIGTADGSNPRIDLISAKNDDTLNITAGTATANPKAPDIPASSVLLAMVYVPASDTAIADNQITDKRVLVAATTGEIFLTASGGWPSTTSGCADATKLEYATNDVDMYSLDFDQTTIEYAQWSIWMPDDWNAGTITYKVVWTASTGTLTNTVEWNLEGRSYANDDPIDAIWGSAVEVSDALIALDDIHYTSVSATITLAGTPAAGEFVQFRMWRDATNDDVDADAKLLGIKIYYTKA